MNESSEHDALRVGSGVDSQFPVDPRYAGPLAGLSRDY